MKLFSLILILTYTTDSPLQAWQPNLRKTFQTLDMELPFFNMREFYCIQLKDFMLS